MIQTENDENARDNSDIIMEARETTRILKTDEVMGVIPPRPPRNLEVTVEEEDQEMPPTPPPQPEDILNLSMPRVIPPVGGIEIPVSPDPERTHRQESQTLGLSLEIQITRNHMATLEYRLEQLERQTQVVLYLINQVAEVVGTSYRYLTDEMTRLSRAYGPSSMRQPMQPPASQNREQ